MAPQELWNNYKKINPSIGDEIDAWAFGAEPVQLAQLVLEGKKTATASAYDLYELDNEPLPQEGSYDVILDSHDEAICIIEITRLVSFLLKRCRPNMLLRKGRGIAPWLGGKIVIGNFLAPPLKKKV